MTLPDQYSKNCGEKEKAIECRAIMHNDCPGTCLYSQQITGVGAMVEAPKQIRKNINQLLEEDLGDY